LAIAGLSEVRTAANAASATGPAGRSREKVMSERYEAGHRPHQWPERRLSQESCHRDPPIDAALAVG
jgi:hypothetical protein